MKILTLVFVSMTALGAQAQYRSYELLQGPGEKQTLITIQKDLKTIGHDKEISSVNIVHATAECLISTKSQELKAGEKYHLGAIYHSSSAPEMTLELVSLDGQKVAAIECDSMSDEAGILQYNDVLGDAALMTNP